MNASDVALFAGLAALIILTQVGTHAVRPWRFLMPLVGTGVVCYSYLHGIPTQGGDLGFDLALGLVGVACGLLASAMVRVERDGASGRIVFHAGLGYAAVWIAAFGGRLLFGWAATHGWQGAVGQFSIDHMITGRDAWTAAFVLMAIAILVTRTLVLAARATMLAVQQRDTQVPAAS